GAYVRNPSRHDLEHLYVLRDALESCAAAEAARWITDSELECLDVILAEAWKISEAIRGKKEQWASRSQLERWLDGEQQFHELVIEASRNPLLVKVVEENRAISDVFDVQRQDPRLLTLELTEQTCRGKEELMEALREHDSDRARSLMSRLIQRGKKTVIGFLLKQGHEKASGKDGRR
ncbi:MAG: FCD domain-containing protein, partial [Verrucomicrobiota bacterium]